MLTPQVPSQNVGGLKWQNLSVVSKGRRSRYDPSGGARKASLHVVELQPEVDIHPILLVEREMNRERGLATGCITRD